MKARSQGTLALFTNHPTAANLLMILMVLVGLASLTKLNRQFFPDFGIDVIQVSVAWPGASAEDVDSNLVAAIEPEVRFLDGVDDIRSVAFEGAAVVSLEYEPGSDMQSALSTVESAISGITTFPDEAEEPVIKRIMRYDLISRLVISGPYSEASLKVIAKQMRDDLLNMGIDKIDIRGIRDEEIWVEIDPARLRQLDMTLGEIAQAIGGRNQDLPSGKVGDGQIRIRTMGQVEQAQALEDLIIKANPSGVHIRLRDIASVREAFNKDQATLLRKGQRAVELSIQRSLNADALELARIIDNYLKDTLPTLPSQLNVERYGIQSEPIKERISLLLENGLSGLVLVIAILFVFLNSRIAFWVAVGIPIAVLTSMCIMFLTGQSINMISLFGMIMAIGIVVDDAIVVGEHADHLSRQGYQPEQAALMGATRMAAPVASATLTTISAFLPLLLIGGIIGDIIRAIPMVVVAILLASLLECFFILPHHLKLALSSQSAAKTSSFRRRFDHMFDWLKNRLFRSFVRRAVAWRYVTVATAFSFLIISFGMVAGGRVGFVFFEDPEPDNISASLEMVAGTSREKTQETILKVEDALYKTVEELGGSKLVIMSITAVGTSFAPNSTSAATETLAGVRVELSPTDTRDVRTQQIINAWRNNIPELAAVKSLSVQAQRGGPPGKDVDIRLTGNDLQALKNASEFIKTQLERFVGVSNIEDNLPYGKPEELVSLNDRGNALGLQLKTVGQQLRHALEGAVAQRFARGDEEVTVKVRYPEESTGISILETIHITTTNGQDVRILDIVERKFSNGFAQIQRVDGKREVAVTAELDKSTITTSEIMEALQRTGPTGLSVLEQMQRDYLVDYQFRGKSEEQAETFGDMKLGGILGLSLIYITLAWIFGSFILPLAILLTIPLGLIGAIWGHYFQDFNITILSLIAMFGLSGIVINDSIVLITTISQKMRTAAPMDAIIEGTCERLRAVLLTSLTTIGGLTPLLFETSRQASFLIPMATTIVFGLAVSTFLILLVVPSLVAILNDILKLTTDQKTIKASETV